MDITLDTIRDVEIYQSKNGYRFSIDALLLYSFVNLPFARRIADLGAGSGIIGILLAKKYPESSVALLELQESLAGLAERNVRRNNLGERVTVIQSDLRNLKSGGAEPALAPHGFDMVVSNPPFRKPRTGRVSPEEEKAVARHEIKLGLPDLMSAAHLLLRGRGRLFLIHHPARLAELIETAKEQGMEIKRLRFVHSHPSSEAKMVLVEAVKEGKPGMKVDPPCFIYQKGRDYSQEVHALCTGCLCDETAE